MAGFARELDAAAGGELAADDGLAGLADGDEVVEDAVDDDFVERGLVAEGGEVELEALGLDAELIGNVVDLEVGAVGLAGDGAEAAELGGVEVDGVVPPGGAIGESLQDAGAGG